MYIWGGLDFGTRARVAKKSREDFSIVVIQFPNVQHIQHLGFPTYKHF